MKKQTVEQQQEKLSKQLKEIAPKLTTSDMLRLAGSVPCALNTLKTYLEGNVPMIHRAETIVKKYNELFQTV